jgi:ferredoxin
VAEEVKQKCPDCSGCLQCSRDRCRLCKKGGREENGWDLGRGFTYGQYQEWKDRREMAKTISIDHSTCTDCESCLTLCPSLFRRNEATGLIEVQDLPQIPEEDVRLAMCMCPAHCIASEEG